jgi:hypothetical protein
MAKLTLPVLGTTLLLAACGAQMPPYPVAPALPPEVVPLPPVSEQQLIWRPGDWAYVDGSYRYEAGGYEPLTPGHGTLWTRGHWIGDKGHYQWVPGQWS